MTKIRPYFLIAMPQLQDPNFYQSVVLIIPAPGDGEFGLVINRQTPLTMDKVKHKGDLPSEMRQMPISFGGPIAPENLIIIAKGAEQPEDTVKIEEGIYLGSSLDFIRSTCETHDTGWKFRSFSGHAGWTPGQLEGEITNSMWLVAPFKAELLFDEDINHIWTKAVKLLGIDATQLYTESSTTIQ